MEVNMVRDQDLELYRAWVNGETQAEIAARHGVTQQAINQRIAKVQGQLPAPVKDQEVRRAAEQADEALAVYLPKALRGDTAASREARGWSLLKARWLGFDRREVQVQGQVEHFWSPGPTVDELMERWLDQGKIKGQLTRTDR
jgi:DNA-binding CsgD family transcriptional regulator